ncbi:MAG: universal stress protein [Bacteroidetes bacterium]|nr:universal stress protein [Bacteroidota bacterium]
MQTLLVPTDFSKNAYNAALYAIALAEDIQSSKIILYNAYEPYVAEDPELGMPIQMDLEEFRKISTSGLAKMKEVLEQRLPASLELVCESEYNLVTTGIISACKRHQADLIVMGIRGAGTKLEEAIIGSTSIDVARESKTPVIIVPADASFSKLKKVLLALDFKKTAGETAAAAIKKLLTDTNASLDVLHVEINKSHETTASDHETFESLFNDYNPQFHFVKGNSFTEAIDSFAIENKTDLIIVIPKKHGLFEGIFKPSHTKALAFHSHIPVMTLQE